MSMETRIDQTESDILRTVHRDDRKRVTRSTYAAELHGAADASEPGKLVAILYSEITYGVVTGTEHIAIMNQCKWPLPIEIALDARSVFESIIARTDKPPTEASLIVILLSIKEQCRLGLVRTLWWVDTEDMVADALTKGVVLREAILKLMSTGTWATAKPFKKHAFVQTERESC